MKKILSVLAVAAFATASHGASIAWSVSNVAFDGTKLAGAGSELTASLVYLGSKGALASSYTQEDIDGLTVVATASGTTSKSANTGTYTLTVGKDNNDDVFGLLLSYTSGGKTYYNMASTPYTLSGFSDASSVIDKYTIAATSMAYGSKDDTSTSVTPGGGWMTAQAVPEPSTAILGLVGLALMLKRRRA